ncbi:Histidinol dehydrogenase [Alkalidesulfovibrio alkalitolerans DSM 16529]|jgi:histidinol dehydrogenase|uniref:Histidinol dehydrogenase n=1 Tax=Alkalidesulfovibrio alkalitolerans DSM 16529 TaxID=1121439 RepID=S7T0L2_9BACT|nr:histidinol dehydrogenase [Alkalidesulfovibrio alkalitolerans]EPR30617.1 Histidinol dehydrogenase [Alkalidesulfovibrio alkalitolerans DSM 16529]
MPCRTIAYTGPETEAALKSWLDARRAADPAVERTVLDILADVTARGDEALVEYTRRFDCPAFEPDMLRVAPERIKAAPDEIPATDFAIIREAAANIRAFHERQRRNSWMQAMPDGGMLGQMVRPVDRAGLYVPGGKGGETPLVSSLLMNAIPARVAGVEGLAVCSPPRADGSLNPYILAAAALLEIDEVYAVGSAWAIAALGQGTDAIPAVDVIAGPGNIFVTTAKRLLIGRVGIDMIAGPSEIAILADETAKADWLAADMLSQAEHDPLAACLLVTTSPELGEAVKTALASQLDALPRADLARKALHDWGGVVVVPDLEAGLACINLVAPEHLEVVCRDGFELLGRIRHAGAVFLGGYAPEPVGDYFAGPNHVLPTLGTARFSSALSVETFMKTSSLIATSRSFTLGNADKIARLARLEGLEAHARSVEIRKDLSPKAD